MEEEIICNRWKDLADEPTFGPGLSWVHQPWSFLAFGNSGYPGDPISNSLSHCHVGFLPRAVALNMAVRENSLGSQVSQELIHLPVGHRTAGPHQSSLG